MPNRLQAKIIEQKLTCEKVAAAIGISRTSFSKKMNGGSKWNLDEVQQLREILGLSRDDLHDIFFN